MTQALIEHVNLTVSDTTHTADMLCQIFGWHIRWQGPAQRGGWTIHVGNETDYLAVWSTQRDFAQPAEPLKHKKAIPLNHVGIVVDDLDATEARVLEYGLNTFSHDDYEPGRRFYFFDPDGIEYEIVSYPD